MTAILWLLKSMSEHVITVVDEETNKISMNLRLYSKHFQLISISGVPAHNMCLFCSQQ